MAKKTQTLLANLQWIIDNYNNKDFITPLGYYDEMYKLVKVKNTSNFVKGDYYIIVICNIKHMIYVVTEADFNTNRDKSIRNHEKAVLLIIEYNLARSLWDIAGNDFAYVNFKEIFPQMIIPKE